MKYILIIFIFGLLLRAVVRFILPVINISRAAHDRMKQMQDQINEMNRKQAEPTVQHKPFTKKGDYIDYEEINSWLLI